MKDYKYLLLILFISILSLIILVFNTKEDIDNEINNINSIRNEIKEIDIITDNPDDLNQDLKGEYELWNRKTNILNSYLQS